MPEVPVDVTYTDPTGTRHTLRIKTTSIFQAALNFETQIACAFPGAGGIPKPDRDAILEVRRVDTGKTYKVQLSRVWQWANTAAARRS